MKIRYWYYECKEHLTRNIPRFFRNIWLFRKALYNYTWWGGHFSVMPFMGTAISDIALNIETKGHEERISAGKKITKMKRAVEIIDHFVKEDFVEMAESELGPLFWYPFEVEESPDNPGLFTRLEKETPEEKAHNSKVFDRSREIESELWKELWSILEGQDYEKFEKPTEPDLDKSHDFWLSQFDGSDLRSWWD